MSRRVGIRTIASIGAAARRLFEGFSDDFNDNVRDATKWDIYANGQAVPASVDETDQEVRVNPHDLSGSGGYVTVNTWNIDGGSIEIDARVPPVPMPGWPFPPERIGILISKTKVTDTDVLDENDWYFLCYYQTFVPEVFFRLYRRVGGGSISQRYSKPAAAGTAIFSSYQGLKIVVSGGNIAVYEDEVQWYTESFALDTTRLYIYIMAWHALSLPCFGYLDNFVLEEA